MITIQGIFTFISVFAYIEANPCGKTVHCFCKDKWAVLFLSAFLSSVALGSIDIPTSQVDITIPHGFNHTPLSIPFDSGGEEVSVSSDASWVSAVADNESGVIKLEFSTSDLAVSSSTATITATNSTASDIFFVRANTSPLNITKLLDDPFRSRMYGIQQNGVNEGCVVVLNPVSGEQIGCISAGKKPSDLAISNDGTELFVINSVDETISVFELSGMVLKETIVLPAYENRGASSTTADIAVGPGSTIYYVDGSSAPVLRVYDRLSETVKQSVTIDGNGFGDIAVNQKQSKLYGWVQYGWSAGWMGSYIVRYSINPDGTLSFEEKANSNNPTLLRRDPLDSPVALSSDGDALFVKQVEVNAQSVSQVLSIYPSDICSISPGGEIVATKAAIHEAKTGNKLLDLPGSPTVQAISSDYARFVSFNTSTKSLDIIDLMNAIGPDILEQNLSPRDQSITLAPGQLIWSAVPGVDLYDVYLGNSELDLEGADTNSLVYKGQVNASQFTVSPISFAAGETYYWRVDAHTQAGTSKGIVHSFTVSTISSDLTYIDTVTVEGHDNHQVRIELDSASPTDWRIETDQPWISFVNSTGCTPGTVTVKLDASDLSVGVHEADLTLYKSANPLFSIPVLFNVEALKLRHIESDPDSIFSYAVSGGDSASESAYLLEINTLTEKIDRVIPAGSSVTDLAIHNGDNRIYVPNWRAGSLLAIDRSSFELEQTYGFNAFGGTGYGDGDVYRVSAGAPGRLIIEEEDQWIDVSIFDTSAGTRLATTFEREGGGASTLNGRYYYHGDNNSSGASLHKFDLLGDAFTEMADKRVTSGGYYGSRTVTASADGQRIFWNGSVFNADLAEEWEIGEHIYACSSNGSLAFAESNIYDIPSRQIALKMPLATKVSSMNTKSGKLVLQQGGKIAFYEVTDPLSLPTPTLSTGSVFSTSVELNWTDKSLETGFTLQMRESGLSEWQDVNYPVSANITNTMVSGLDELTAYEFRIKADSPLVSSGWSAVVTASTPATPLSTPLLWASSVTATQVSLSWTDVPGAESYLLERLDGQNGSWLPIATNDADSTSFADSNVSPAATYSYRVKARSQAEESSWSTVIEAETPQLPSMTGIVQFRAAEYTVGENGPSVEIEVTRTGGSEGVASVDYATVNGSAMFGLDYVRSTGVLNWADGDSLAKTFHVPIVDDIVYERDETFTLELSSAIGAGLGRQAQCRVEILENDIRPADRWDGDDENPPAANVDAPRRGSERGHGPHSLSRNDDCDWFNIYLWRGVDYTIWSSGDDDVQAQLYSDTNAVQLVASDDNSGLGSQFSIFLTPDQSGNYYLCVSSSPKGENAAYTLHYRGGLDTWYYDATDLGADWAWLDWLGLFKIERQEYIRHFQHGWLYPFESGSPESMTFWDNEMDAFWWTSRSGYPYLFRFRDTAWLWYLKGSTDPRWFINLKTMQWEEW